MKSGQARDAVAPRRASAPAQRRGRAALRSPRNKAGYRRKVRGGYGEAQSADIASSFSHRVPARRGGGRGGSLRETGGEKRSQDGAKGRASVGSRVNPITAVDSHSLSLGPGSARGTGGPALERRCTLGALRQGGGTSSRRSVGAPACAPGPRGPGGA